MVDSESRTLSTSQNVSLSTSAHESSVLFTCTPSTPICAPFDTQFSSRGPFQKIVKSVRKNSDVSCDEAFVYVAVSEDEFDNLQRKYGELNGEIVIVELFLNDIPEECRRSKSPGLGISLCGNRDLNQMAVLVCGLRPDGVADRDGRIAVGDQLLELNEHILYGRSHLNAAPIILSSYLSILRKSSDAHHRISDACLRFVIHRYHENIANLASPLIAYISASQKASRKNSTETGSSPKRKTGISYGVNPPNRHTYEEVHVTRLLRGRIGFGFAIMDKSFMNEPGIYIKQLVENGPAHLDGVLRAGDRLLRVDWHDALHATYESVLECLRSAKHQVRIVVSRVRLSTDPSRPVDDELLKLCERKRLSVPLVASFFNALMHPYSSKKISLQSNPEETRQCRDTESIKDNCSIPKTLDLLSPEIADLDVRRASCPDQFTPGFAKRLANNNFLGVVSMSSLTYLSNPPPPVIPLRDPRRDVQDSKTEWKIGRSWGPSRNSSKATGSRTSESSTRSSDRQKYLSDGELATTRPVVPGQEIRIKIRRNLAPSLGITLIGGRETSLGKFQVHEIFPNGAAFKDGRLQPGDRVIAVNGQCLASMTFSAAVTAIDTAFSGLSPVPSDADLATIASANMWTGGFAGGKALSPVDDSFICLVVERPTGVQTKWYDQEVIVELTKKPGRGLGICLAERAGPVSQTCTIDAEPQITDGQAIMPTNNGLPVIAKASDSRHEPAASLGVIISDLIKGSIACMDGRLMIGDQILSIDDVDVQSSSQEEVATLLKAAQSKVVLRLGRLKNQPHLLNSAVAFVSGQQQA